MPHIDALLPLYPDAASRRDLLQQALAQIRADLSAIDSAIGTGDHPLARQLTHRAKGTVSFLGNPETLHAFDTLTGALRAGDPVRIGQAYPPVEQGLLELQAILQQRLHTL